MYFKLKWIPHAVLLKNDALATLQPLKNRLLRCWWTEYGKLSKNVFQCTYSRETRCYELEYGHWTSFARRDRPDFEPKKYILHSVRMQHFETSCYDQGYNFSYLESEENIGQESCILYSICQLHLISLNDKFLRTITSVNVSLY